MQFLIDIGRLIFSGLPYLVLSSPLLMVLLLCLGLVALQYRRISTLEEAIYGLPLNLPAAQTAYSLVYGVVGGVVGSFVIALAGVALPLIPREPFVLWYLWPLALTLALIHPRYTCFAYAGTLIALSRLLFGWPRVDVASMLGLVAVLHLVEALLVWFSALSCRTPVAVQNGRGETVAGFSLQRFWPVPVMLLFIDPAIAPAGGALPTPAWWPLLHPDVALFPGVENLVYAMQPAMVVMGYSDLAVAQSPAVRVRKTGWYLLVYSVLLLLLSIAATRVPALLWAAALFCGIGHEFITVGAARGQLTGGPVLQRPPRGVGIHDVLPGSPAEAAGLHTGDVIIGVDDMEVHSRQDMVQAFHTSPAYLRIMYRSGAQLEHRRLPRPEGGLSGFGAILLPEPGDAATVKVAGSGAVLRWLLQLVRR